MAVLVGCERAFATKVRANVHNAKIVFLWQQETLRKDLLAHKSQ
jgi:hypothetical protein